MSLRKVELMPLIIKQLLFYNMNDVAKQLAAKIGVHPDEKSDRLARLTYLGQEADLEKSSSSSESIQGDVMETTVEKEPTDAMDFTDKVGNIGTFYTSKLEPAVAPQYVASYTTIHKLGATTSCFSPDGTMLATGSFDNSLKVLDVDKLKNRDPNSDEKPIIKTLYDHTAVCFHIYSIPTTLYPN